MLLATLYFIRYLCPTLIGLALIRFYEHHLYTDALNSYFSIWVWFLRILESSSGVLNVCSNRGSVQNMKGGKKGKNNNKQTGRRREENWGPNSRDECVIKEKQGWGRGRLSQTLILHCMLVTGNRGIREHRERKRERRLMYSSGADKKTGGEMGNTLLTLLLSSYIYVNCVQTKMETVDFINHCKKKCVFQKNSL